MVNEPSKKRMKRTAFFAACQKFKREIILFCPFFDINSALFSVPLIYELDRTHRVVLLLFLACEVREHLMKQFFYTLAQPKKNTKNTRVSLNFFLFFQKSRTKQKLYTFFSHLSSLSTKEDDDEDEEDEDEETEKRRRRRRRRRDDDAYRVSSPRAL